jgi:hypothetical protein
MAAVYSPIILGGPATEKEIKDFLRTCSRARLAVAYWGEGAIVRLALDALKRRRVDIEIICDLMSGACNPVEIGKLVKLFGKERVRTKDGLHAKVWITDTGCVLGSSNVSANGLGHEADETRGLIEANLTFPTMPSVAMRAWESWYEAFARAGSMPIDDVMLKEASKRWKTKRAARFPLPEAIDPQGSLLAELRRNPKRFRDKPFKVVIHEHVDRSPEAQRGLEIAIAEHEEAGGRGHWEAYEGWQIPGGTYVLDFEWDLTTRTAKLDGLWKILSDRPFRRLSGTSITLCTRAASFEGLSITRERADLSKAATIVMRSRRKKEITVTGEEFGHLLAAAS